MEEYRNAQEYGPAKYDEYIMALTASADEGWSEAIKEFELEMVNDFPRYSLQNYNVTKKFYKNRSGLFSQYALASFYRHRANKYGKAKNIYLTLSEKGLRDATNALGFMYQKGCGVPLDNKIACKYYKMSVKAGSISGYNNLAFMYQKGLGVKQNYEKAAKYYKLAIKYGNIHGLDNLCWMYKFFYRPDNVYEVISYFLEINQTNRLKDAFSFEDLLEIVLRLKHENNEMKNHILASPEGSLYFEALADWKKDAKLSDEK